MLGLLESSPWSHLGPDEEAPDPTLPFVSTTTTKFSARMPDRHTDYGVWDCRHGRVLLGEKIPEHMKLEVRDPTTARRIALREPMKLAVWDPMTGRRRELQEPSCMVMDHTDGLLAAAVLCAISGCDHRACHEGPFRVVFFSLHYDNGNHFVAQACVSLRETIDCSEPCSAFHRPEWSEPCAGLPIFSTGFIEPRPPVLVKDAIHFMVAYEHEPEEDREDEYPWLQILKYDLNSNSLSLIKAPSGTARSFGDSILMALEDGSLGFARWKRLRLYIWSRQIGSDGAAAWTRHRVISLKNIPPIKEPRKRFRVLGSVEGSNIIFVYTELSIYKINLKTLRRKKICEKAHFNALIPYMSFYNINP
jgi:hypothetical protein